MIPITIIVKPRRAVYEVHALRPEERGMKVSKETSAKHREELLNAASRLFRERGFDKVGIAEIAAAAASRTGPSTRTSNRRRPCAQR
jgi:AcrR family transcriptional regulator